MGSIEQEIRKLRAQHQADPSDVTLSVKFWNSLGNCGGQNVQRMSYLIEAFREAALAAPKGVAALCNAANELYETSGERPTREFFDDRLIAQIVNSIRKLPKSDVRAAKWILGCLNEDQHGPS